ncbi:hypothetical protein MACH09_46170 [Vibrio sp. MACH09]|nr:hypothetical protein MACH09_46170 [Vibrio sp. MACH09]
MSSTIDRHECKVDILTGSKVNRELESLPVSDLKEESSDSLRKNCISHSVNRWVLLISH